ncbi:hypothetical protein KJS94_07005 [Flavihumibacter rivuli]|uniref:hypothetical protein n=1 Tax=Flavihumibacter rivuli TaxID=2838156 RepID=UPI001BDF28E3|nr:hypothetical protein [Flavihumibacter rivuli]ULQ57947.1 hypothetical protein KJS94_07005 [Flavihumibacter rivuli]
MNSNSYIIFTKRLLILVAAFLLLDLALGNTLKKFYFSQQTGIDYHTIYSVEKTKEEILFFGSSRASHHYVPRVFTDKFSMTAFNTGRDGNFILYGYSVLQATLKRYTPKMVVLDISQRELEKKEGGYDYLSSLLPFYKGHPEMRDVLDHRTTFEKVKVISAIYPFNSLFPMIAANNLKKDRSYLDAAGYSPLKRTMNREAEQRKLEKEYELDPYLEKIFREFLVSCKSKQVPVVVITSPYFDNYGYRDPSLAKVAEIAKQEGVLYLDYAKDPRYVGQKGKFDDYHHLNDSAAHEFSAICADSIARSGILTNVK